MQKKGHVSLQKKKRGNMRGRTARFFTQGWRVHNSASQLTATAKKAKWWPYLSRPTDDSFIFGMICQPEPERAEFLSPSLGLLFCTSDFYRHLFLRCQHQKVVCKVVSCILFETRCTYTVLHPNCQQVPASYSINGFHVAWFYEQRHEIKSVVCKFSTLPSLRNYIFSTELTV